MIVLIIRIYGTPRPGAGDVAVVPGARVVSLVSQDKRKLTGQTRFGFVFISRLATYIVTFFNKELQVI